MLMNLLKEEFCMLMEKNLTIQNFIQVLCKSCHGVSHDKGIGIVGISNICFFSEQIIDKKHK